MAYLDMKITELKVGDTVRILGFEPCDRVYQSRLLAMGFVPDVEFTLLRVAPLGDPVEVKILNTTVCLRKAESQILQLEPIGITS